MEDLDFDGIAHEIWATAQLLPGEGIEDGAQRVFDLLIGNFKKPLNKAVEHEQANNEPCPKCGFYNENRLYCKGCAPKTPAG